MSEKLSALIDNELDDLERIRVLRELGGDGELAERWSRYHMIGLAMRRERIVAPGNIPENVARAIADGQIGDTPPHSLDNSGSVRRSIFRVAGRYAVAASVAAVLLVGGIVVKLYEDGRPTSAAPPGAAQLALGGDETRWEDVDPRVEDTLNALLVEHGEFTSASGMNGLTAYTKYVAYDSH